MKILVVDDNAEMRRFICSLVADLASEVHECTCGEDALPAFAQHRPDWVLMDVKMAGMDGLTATRQIRAASPEARVVIVTHWDDEALREASAAAGACAFVCKNDLLALRPLLQRHGVAGSA